MISKLLAMGFIAFDSIAAGPTTEPITPPLAITGARDHQHMMDLLHITTLRSVADSKP